MRYALIFGLFLTLAFPAQSACTFAEENKGSGTNVTSGTSATVSATIHALGDVVAIFARCSTSSSTSCVMGNVTVGSQTATSSGTSFTQTGTKFFQGRLYYVTSATVSSTQTITFNWTNTISSAQVGYIDFTPSGCGTISIDSGAGFPTSTGSSTTVNAPSITTTSSGELEYFAAAVANTGSSVNTPWTQGTIYATSTNMDGYILSSSGSATAAAASQTPTGQWAAGAMAFKNTPSGGCSAYRSLMGAGC